MKTLNETVLYIFEFVQNFSHGTVLVKNGIVKTGRAMSGSYQSARDIFDINNECVVFDFDIGMVRVLRCAITSFVDILI